MQLDSENKELKDLRAKAQAAVESFFENVCNVDFKMDHPVNKDGTPSEAVKLCHKVLFSATDSCLLATLTSPIGRARCRRKTRRLMASFRRPSAR